MPPSSSTPEPPAAAFGPRTEEQARWKARSRKIRFWRRALPMIIIGVVAILVLWIGGRSAIVKLTTLRASKESGIRMLNPRFYGRDNNNRPFVVGAAEAARDTANARTVTLKSPTVTIDAGGASPTHVQSTDGIYHEDQRRLNLGGKVELQTGHGYRFTTPQAVVDTSTGHVTGDKGVQGQGPLGRIAASSYAISDRGQRIVLKGDVHAHIVQ